jgi:hypothetical protein
MKTPFALPTDPLQAAQVAAKFFQAVELPQLGAEAACWRHRGRLFQCQLGYVRYTTTAARAMWTIVYGETLGADDHLRHGCGNLDCVRPDHLRRYDKAQLAAAAVADVQGRPSSDAAYGGPQREAWKRRMAVEARAWIDADDRSWPYSFTNICHVLGLDPAGVRRALAGQTGGVAPTLFGGCWVCKSDVWPSVVAISDGECPLTLPMPIDGRSVPSG